VLHTGGVRDATEGNTCPSGFRTLNPWQPSTLPDWAANVKGTSQTRLLVRLETTSHTRVLTNPPPFAGVWLSSARSYRKAICILRNGTISSLGEFRISIKKKCFFYIKKNSGNLLNDDNTFYSKLLWDFKDLKNTSIPLFHFAKYKQPIGINKNQRTEGSKSNIPCCTLLARQVHAYLRRIRDGCDAHPAWIWRKSRKICVRCA
jgi:hypothetical protein